MRLIDWGYAKLDSDRCAVDMGGIKRLDFSPFSVLRGQLLKEKWYKAVEDNLSTDTSLSKTEVLQRYDDALHALEVATRLVSPGTTAVAAVKVADPPQLSLVSSSCAFK